MLGKAANMGGEYIIDTWLDWFFSDEYEEEGEENESDKEVS